LQFGGNGLTSAPIASSDLFEALRANDAHECVHSFTIRALKAQQCTRAQARVGLRVLQLMHFQAWNNLRVAATGA
jgi:hypothetical protein